MNQNQDYLKGLSLLRPGQTKFPQSPDEARLETFANRYPDRDYWITFDCPEFTTLCPVTNQPDFGHIIIRYVPDQRCVESKSLKLYLFSFRQHHTFHEESVNRIRDDFARACAPRQLVVEGDFNPRGGISIKVRAEYRRETGAPPPPASPQAAGA